MTQLLRLKIRFLWLLLVLLALQLHCQTVQAPVEPQVRFFVHESAFNTFLAKIGSISGKGNQKSGAFQGEYVWTVSNPHLVFEKDKASFVADVNLKSGVLNYDTQAKGDVNFLYDDVKNMFGIQVKKAMIEVAVTILGNRIKLTDLDVATFYRPDFQFSGPSSLQSQIDLNLPDGRKKRMLVKPTHSKLSVDDRNLVLSADLEMTEIAIPTPAVQSTVIPGTKVASTKKTTPLKPKK